MDKIFACVDNQSYLSFDKLSQGMLGTDFEIVRDIPLDYPPPFAGLPAGHYRLVDRIFLAWIEQRIEAAIRSPHVDSEVVGRAVKFFQDVRDAAAAIGITPAPHSEIPPDYRKPGLTAEATG